MKKSKFILTTIAMASMFVLTGCNAEISLQDSTGEETSTIVIETNTEETTEPNTVDTNATNNEENSNDNLTEETQTDSAQDVEEDVFTEVNEDWNYVLTSDEEFAYLFEVKYDEATSKEYATIICQGEKGAYWTYETDKYEVGQCCSLEILESPVNVIYLNEGGTIKALNISDGNTDAIISFSLFIV